MCSECICTGCVCVICSVQSTCGLMQAGVCGVHTELGLCAQVSVSVDAENMESHTCYGHRVFLHVCVHMCVLCTLHYIQDM